MKRIVNFLAMVVIATALSCHEKSEEIVNKFGDPVLIKIYDFKDRRLGDSLYQYFSSSNEVYREEAALAFASIQDSSAIAALGNMLSDENSRVRAATAFSIGQMKSPRGEQLLVELLKTEKDKFVRDELIEAYGKVTKRWDPSIMPLDSSVSDRFSWSIYRAGLRGMAGPRLDSVAAILLGQSYDQSNRLGAAHYFSRTGKNFERFESKIINSALSDPSEEVRIASTLALGKIATDSALSAVRRVLKNEKDYRVRVSAVRGLRLFPFKKTKPDFMYALTDTNISVPIAASELLVSALDNDSWKEFLPLCRDTKNSRVRANLYAAVLSVSDNKEVAEEVVRACREATDPYEKAHLLSALGYSVMSFGFIQEQLTATDIPVIKTAAANSLVSLNYQKNFNAALKEKFAAIYRKAVEDGDPGVIATVCSALADSALGYRGVINDITFLIEAKKKLSLPMHIETIVPLNAAIAYLEGAGDESSGKNTFNNPIDWSVVKAIPKEQMVSMSTSKGEIIIKLYVEEAPGSVANFVSRVNEHYYDDKFFHRVVPNFVAQAGCKRGDGFGSEDYSIRSEFSRRRYTTGSLGMASAGKDTEGTQWFITHSPTPHLDGAYSIFGEVVKGMDIVHSLEVGDKILKINLIR